MKLSRLIMLVVLLSGLGAAARSQTPATSSTAWATTSARGTVSQQPPTPDWWTAFQDAELTQLVERAVAIAEHLVKVAQEKIVNVIASEYVLVSPGPRSDQAVE